MADPRDVKLDISVETFGVEAVRSLAKDVADLAKKGGDAAPEFQRLASELDKIAQQDAAIQSFAVLQREIAELAETQQRAAAGSQAMREQLDAVSATTRIFAEAEERAKLEVREGIADVAAKRTELAKLRNETDNAGRKSEDYRASVSRLNLEIIEASSALREKREAARQASEATRAAAAEESTLAKQTAQAEAATRRASIALTSRNEVLSTTETALRALGVSTTNVDEANDALVSSFTQTKQALESTIVGVEALERAEKELAAQDAFARKAADAEKLAEASRRLSTYQAEIEEVLQAERRLAESQALADKAAEAAKLPGAERYVTAFRTSVEMADRALDELREQAAFDKLAADAQKMAAASRYATELAAELERVEKAELAAANGAKALANAFATAGVRSTQAIEKEIADINAALRLLSTNLKVTGPDFNRAFAAAQPRLAALNAELRGVSKEANIGTAVLRAMSGAVAQLGGAYAAFEVGRSFIDANVQLETMRRTLTLVTGSTEAATANIDRLREVASNSGVAISAISDAYTRFASSANLAGIEMSVVNDVFAAVTRASGQMGLGSAQAERALEALAQMAAKGVVSMEELRQQLGDSLPGALAQAARGIGRSTEELVAMVESGQVLARDMLPALAVALTETMAKGTKDVEGFAASWARAKNALNETMTAAGDSGVMSLLSGLLDNVAQRIRNTNAEASMFATLMRETGAAITGTGTVSERLGRIWNGLTGETHRLQQEQKRLAAETKAVNTEVADSIKQWFAITAEYGKARTAADATTKATVKLTEAKKLEGDAGIRLAQISGNVQVAVEAATAASRGNAQAAAELVVARQREVELLTQQIGSLQQTAKALGDEDGARAKVIEGLEKELVAKQANLERSAQALEVSEAEVLAREATERATRDNADALDKLRANYESLHAIQVAHESSLIVGVEATERAAKAKRDATLAEADYRDALADTTARLGARQQVAQADLTLAEAGLNLQLRQAQTSEMYYRRIGDEVGAMQARIRQREIEIQIMQAQNRAATIEADLSIQQIERDREELVRSGQMNETKRLEIEARLRNAEAKRLEAELGAENVRQIQEEIRALREYNDVPERAPRQQRGGGGGGSGGGGGGGGGLPGQRDRDGNLLNRDGSMAGGFGNANPVDMAFAIQEKLNSGNLTLDDLAQAREAHNQARNASGWLDSMQGSSAGSVSTSARNGADALLRSTGEAVKRLEAMEAEQKRKERLAANEAAQQRSGTPVNISILGKPQKPVNVAGSEDADALAGILQQLEDAKARYSV